MCNFERSRQFAAPASIGAYGARERPFRFARKSQFYTGQISTNLIIYRAAY